MHGWINISFLEYIFFPLDLFLEAVVQWPATSLKKRFWHRCFPVNFVTFLRTPFLQKTSGGCFCILFSSIEKTYFMTARDFSDLLAVKHVHFLPEYSFEII